MNDINDTLNSSAVEKALIDAIQFRYQAQDHPNGDFTLWHKDYIKAMESVYKNFSDDLDVATLYADALMNLTPWGLWDLKSGLVSLLLSSPFLMLTQSSQPRKGARTLEVKQVLDKALSQPEALTHPGILHLNIHLMEMSSTPEVALPLANHLRDLVPDAGHLLHMPSHLDVICGDYPRAIVCNTIAIAADAKYFARAGALNFYTLYRCHNYHFRIYAAMFCGKSQIALETSAEIGSLVTEEVLRIEKPPMANWLEGFAGTRFHAMVRFGKWKEIIALALPEDQELYCVTTAMIHYAKGVAYASTNKIAEATQQRKLFNEAKSRVPDSRFLFNNKCIDILKVAALMLDGELAYRRGDFNSAFDLLALAVKADDALPFDEPWAWMQPTRHALGALLLEQGHIEKALAVYSADLGMDETLPRVLRHPNNVWSLHGYHECLMRLGRREEAEKVEGALKAALEIADVPIRSSCFCRVGGERAVVERVKPLL